MQFLCRCEFTHELLAYNLLAVLRTTSHITQYGKDSCDTLMFANKFVVLVVLQISCSCS